MAQINDDLEDGRRGKEYLDGYVDFSEFIASDYSLSIYRKFGSLAARNLLYLQAELQLLQFQLAALDDADDAILKSPGNGVGKARTENANRSWDDLKQQALEGDTRQAERLRMIYELRRLMKEYEEALLRRNQVLALEKPAKVPFRAFKNWFRDKVPLRGSGFHLLDAEDDMIALGSQAEPDRMSSVIHRCCGYYVRKERATPRSWGPMYYYPVERVSCIVAILSILVSAALLVGAIVALHFIKPTGIRVAIVGLFTLLFAASIVLFTYARRVEVYGATAAYAAVLVVFISVNS